MRAASEENHIDSVAADWVARADRGLSADESEQFAAWLRADARHRGAYARAEAISVHFERAKALGAAFDFRSFADDQPAETPKRVFAITRRHWMSGAAAAAALAGVGLLYYAYILPNHYSTALGEIRTVPLPDGSVATLNTRSAIVARYTPLGREIRLIAGEVLFDVAKDPGRPFVVMTGKTSVRAVGTSFTVRRLEGQSTEVLVREGIVDISNQVSVPVPLRVPANTRAIVMESPGGFAKTIAIDASVVARELSWRDGMIAFEGVTLREAAEEFARYSSTHIVIADPEIAALPITGLFSAHNPSGFAHAVATSFGLKVGVTADGMLMLWK